MVQLTKTFVERLRRVEEIAPARDELRFSE
jgi:hypothetical protein